MKLHHLKAAQLDKAIGEGPAKLRRSPMPAGGWLKAVRTALGAPARQVAAQAGIASTGVAAAERGERAGTITLNQLRKLAAAMDCELVYGLAPRTSLRQQLEHRAAEVADQLVRTSAHSMSLEDQRTGKTFEHALREETKRKLLSSPRKLWRYSK
ncbi:MAG: transcriptional regulator [Pseudomonadota bacterium]